MEFNLDENTPICIGDVLRDKNGNPEWKVIEVKDDKTFTMEYVKKPSHTKQSQEAVEK